ncbi:MAG: DUF502 domain-containing protein [Phycisphaerales bacterium]|nr:DUF502 domain-containing protein [Phycisphaerales bacterium]
MGDTKSRRGNFRRSFLRGLAVVLPATLTLWVLVQAYLWVDRSIAQPINAGVRALLVELFTHWQGLSTSLGLTPSTQVMEDARRAMELAPTDTSSDSTIISEYYQGVTSEWWSSIPPLRLIGLIIAIIGVYLAGRFVGGLVGRLAYRWLERVITSLPVVKKIYSWIKQVVDFLFRGQEDKQAMKFSRVVAVQYPRKGIWSVGFQTGRVMKSMHPFAGDSAITIFIPSSPTPFTGYTITVPKEDTIDLPLTVEEAIGFTISGGVLRPPSELLPAAEAYEENDQGTVKKEDST